MAPISLKIVLEDGAVTRKVKFNSTDTVQLAHQIVKEKVLNADNKKEYALFLPCTDDDLSGVWLENHRTLEYYMLRDGDTLEYICKMRNLRVRLLDDTVKTLQVDQAKNIADLLQNICGRIGITNWDEYGLCRDNEESEDSKELKPGQTSTLRPKHNPKDRDVEMEQLSKKLKTDDNVEWLDQYKTLREMAVGPNETLLLKRRLFYSDRNVDSRDPVQLNLLYVQTRDAILNGTHPVTEDQAAQFAGIQCQIHFGDFQEDKHKPGWIENLNEYLPEQYSGTWGIEKKILKEYRKHQGLSPIDAKYFYTKTARDLPTYGVTFFLVKEKLHNKKKLVPRLLGINAESILRLDETTKEILQVWPLSHVKTYHTGKTETFTLNFGDYSDKEYCVKTRDAHRIRDILEGYIDIIRKRMLAKHNVDSSESMVIGQEYVAGSKGNIIQHFPSNTNKIVEQTFVGPSKILPFEKGDQISQGTQIVTVQQIMVSDQANKAQHAVKGEAGTRSDMSWNCIKCLNKLNTNSVKIVEFLTDPNDTNLRDARKVLRDMQNDLPVVVDGVKKTAENQKSEEAKKKLLDELQELEEYMKNLVNSMDQNNFDCTEADDSAKKVADLTTQMYFSLDPRTRRRSDMLRRSRKSFIADERTEASLHRASFLAAANTALHCVDNAGTTLKEPYSGEPLSQDDVEELQKGMTQNVAALNAALALYLQAHADPYCIDYSAALASMNSIQELMPELAKNAQALGSVKSDEDRQKYLDEIQALLDAARNVCTITGTGDHEKMQENSIKYADVASKLIFTLGRGSPCNKNDEIIDLAKQVGDKTSLLLSTTNELTCQAPGEAATAEVDKMGVKTAHCARDLLACAHLTAPAIRDPHCRSALTASAEALSSAARQLAAAWRPLAEDPTRQPHAKPLQQRTTDLTQAVEKLMAAYADMGEDDAVFNDTITPSEVQRLKFIKSASLAKNNLELAKDELKKPLQPSPNDDTNKLHEDLEKKIMQLNAAIASLIAATSDRSNPDYVTAELALSTITDLMPDVVKESKMVAAGKDGADRAAVLNRMHSLCEASQKMCANADQLGGKEMNDAVSQFADASGKLTYTFGPPVNPIVGQEIIDLAADACAKTTQLLTNVQQISESVGGDLGDELDKRGAKTVDAAQALLKNAEVTARTIPDPRCEAAFISSIEALSSSTKDLAQAWSAVPLSPRRKELDSDLKELEAILDQLRKICGDTDIISSGFYDVKAKPQNQPRLKFINTLSGVKNSLKNAEDELDKPLLTTQVTKEDVGVAQRRLADKMAQLNAAIAALLAANSDRDDPDYVKAEEAIRTISTLMPDVVKETKLMSANKNDAEKAALLDQIRALCGATQKICVSAGQDENLNDSVAQFADASGKLTFVRSKLDDPAKENQILDLSSLAAGKASHLLANVQQLTEAVGGEVGQELDYKGSKTVDAAQALLTSARLTAPSMDELQCQAAFVSSIDALSSSSHDLGRCWRKIGDKPYQGLQNALEKDLKELEAILKELKEASRVPNKGVNKVAPSIPGEQQRLKFINTVSGVKNNLKAVEDDLNKPLPAMQEKKEDVGAAQGRLSDKMAKLNAAIAALVAATSDKENPDYTKAETAITSISRLLPDVVKESKTVAAGKNEKERAAMLDQIRELCDATQKMCASAGQDQGLHDSAAQFAEASDKLKFVISPTADGQKEKQVMGLSSLACANTANLLANVQQLALSVGGDIGQELDITGAKTADAAKTLFTNARLTAPSMNEPQCRAALMSSIDALSSSSQELGNRCRNAGNESHLDLKNILEKELMELEAVLKELREARRVPSKAAAVKNVSSSQPREEQRQRFINTISGVQNNLKAAEDELKKPVPVSQLTKEDIGVAQGRLSDKMAKLNAAIAALLAATSDREYPNYAKAEEAMETINRLMPDVVTESKTVSGGKTGSDRAAILDQIRALCGATRNICASAGEGQDLNELGAKFAEASDKLKFVISPSVEGKQERQVLELSSSAAGKASHLLANVQQLTEAVGGEVGQELDCKGSKTADAAQTLLTNAQLTASTITEPKCQEALMTSIDAFSSSSQDLGDSWRKVKDHSHRNLQNTLEKDLTELEDILKELRAVCRAVKRRSLTTKPDPPVRKSSYGSSAAVDHHRPAPPVPSNGKPVIAKSRPQPPAPPARVGMSQKRKISDINQQFLDRVRFEESEDAIRPRSSSVQSQPPSPCALKTDDEKRMHQVFVKNVEDAKEKIKKTEDSLLKICNAESAKTPAASPLSANELLNKKQSMQESLAAVGVEVAALVRANYADNIDFKIATKATNAIPELMYSIVEDGKIVSGTMKDPARKAFLDDMLKLCESTSTLCDAAKSDREKLNEAAIKFGDNSSKMLHVVSSDVDPTLEKEIINRAKEIGDSASRIALEAVNVAGNQTSAPSAGTDVHNICEAGTKCVDAAGKLVYTAKLVSPSIHNPTCQEALISSADTLSNHLKAFSNTWNPLSPDPIQAKSAQTLARETANLEKLLEGLRRDVKGGAIGRRREIQKLVIEDTPMRQLTMKIIDDAKYMAECPDVPFAKRSEYAAYADRLAEALRELDIANARCNRSPQDTNRRRDLENAIQELQMALLQTRPTADDKPKNNIVDLRDFIQDVSTEANNMGSAAASCRHVESVRGKKAIEDIVAACSKINEDAIKMVTGEQGGVETSFDDVRQVHNFGQECESTFKTINSAIQSIDDEKTRNMLQKKLSPLSEKCNLLMFATMSGLSTAQGASLDETLDDLDDLENKVIKSFVEDAAKVASAPRRRASPPVPPKPWVKSQLCTAVVNAAQRADAQPLPQAFTTYIADAATRADLQDPNEKDNLLKHLYKVVHQLKELTVTTSKRLATWQPLQHPEVSKITEQILQELDHPESKFGVKDSKAHTNVLSAINANKLLLPCDKVKIEGDAKQLKEKVQQLCTKLSMTSSGVLQSYAKPETLSRSLHATVECANQLRAHAHALKNKQDPFQAKKVEEAAQEMSYATYNLLKTAEHHSQSPNHPDTRRKLLDALRQLNDSINKLVRSTSPVNRVSQECEEQTRSLLLHQTSLQGAPHATCALPYKHCLDAIHSQSDVIQKLKSDQKMTKEEFVKNLNFVSSAVCNSTDYATQCAYLLSASEKDKEVAEIGLVDVAKMQKLSSSIQDSCMSIIRSATVEYAEGDKSKLEKQVGDLIQSINESTDKIKDQQLKESLEQCKRDLNVTAIGVSRAFNDHHDKPKLTSSTMELLAAANRTSALIEDPLLQPQTTTVSAERKAWCDDVMNSSKTLITKTQALVKEVKSSPEPEGPDFMMTWHTYNISRKQVLDAFDALLKSVQTNGQRANIIEGSPDEASEMEAPTKSYMQSQLDLIKKWLETPVPKPNAKAAGEQAVQNIIDMADKMYEDMKAGEKDDMSQLISETRHLLNDCKTKYDNEKYSVLLDRVKELKKGVERGVVTRVVEDFIEGDDPLANLDIIVDAEKDETKRKYILEKKLAELLAQLGRVTKTARFIADTGSGDHALSKELRQCSEQTELLAPMLVKAAQERVNQPDNKAIIDSYRSLLAKYAESLSKVRDLCDQAVDPMDFVQTASETMQRMREESTQQNDPIRCVQTSETITKLANRVMNVSMSSRLAKTDPELQKALMEARQRLRNTIPAPNTRASKIPDWRDTTAEILRTTGEVESVLGGENIFKKQPESDQPIYMVALDLHTSIKDWSSRDNEIVAVAKRTAVLMARLSDYMNNDRKRELLATSKAIVTESHEVAYLAKKLAHECTDVRIKTNLLKACERIPTISGQLKMLTTVKGSSLGHQGTEEDKEAMNMLVHNAQSLMLSIQEVVKAAASASVKIMSQRGPRIKWVRKNYY
ncbi:hypothetical protein K1T71_013216 [Dendrolimus kikuchii]|uniref:Uncharacterized protein n=1 Tax=Dendrolimus kikuchii TaxID=765133 RepID=A0ACC1CHG6_9NEOP|nr:hypothetical protein K1T71_013216 [Dendrolimus kikuchii]